MRSVRSRLRVTEAACHSFGRTTGTNRPRSSRMIDGTARLHDPTAQSRKFRNQVVVANQSARHTRPYPPARIRESRKLAIKNVELETLPSCHVWQAASSAATSMIVLPGSRGSRRQRTQSRLRSARISARSIRRTSPDRCAATSRSRFTTAVPPCLKQVDRPRILAALQGSPKRLRAVQRGISRFGPLQNRARPTKKLCRCSGERNPETRPVRGSRQPPSKFIGQPFLAEVSEPIIS